MRIKFWGVRGSLPTSLTTHQLREKYKEVLRLSQGYELPSDAAREQFLEKLPFWLTHTGGGNTTCYEVVSDTGTQVIIDMGTGIRPLGHKMMAQGAHQGNAKFDILVTHTHWDHIMGFPFFVPVYIPGNQIHIHSVHTHIPKALALQHQPICFPVQLDELRAELHYHTYKEGQTFTIGDLTITTKALQHPGTSYSYRITEGDKSIVIATDGEYKQLDDKTLKPYVDFYKDTELLVFDAQYSFAEVFHKVDWGHSSPPIGIDLANKAKAKKLVLVHHDPDSDDQKLGELIRKAHGYRKANYPQLDMDLLMAFEGMELLI